MIIFVVGSIGFRNNLDSDQTTILSTADTIKFILGLSPIFFYGIYSMLLSLNFFANKLLLYKRISLTMNIVYLTYCTFIIFGSFKKLPFLTALIPSLISIFPMIPVMILLKLSQNQHENSEISEKTIGSIITNFNYSKNKINSLLIKWLKMQEHNFSLRFKLSYVISVFTLKVIISSVLLMIGLTYPFEGAYSTGIISDLFMTLWIFSTFTFFPLNFWILFFTKRFYGFNFFLFFPVFVCLITALTILPSLFSLFLS